MPHATCLDAFHPATRAWFTQAVGTPSRVQAGGWPAIAQGGHVLMAAPTGSGKTLAAFLAAIDGLMVQAAAGTLPDRLHVLYISPLKALSADIHKNLEAPLAGIAAQMQADGHGVVRVRSACRTGDTPQSERQRILRKPPHILVTTPESLYLLLGSVSGHKLLRHVRTVILDEVHALANNRRGSHLALSLEHLSEIAETPPQRIGLSATQRPMAEVARFLVGTGGIGADGTPACTLVDVTAPRDIDVRLALPDSPLEAIMSHTVWEEVYAQLTALVQGHTTTLIFVNTRRMAERLAFCLAERLGENTVVAHHGSLAAQVRHEAEQRLRAGDLKALVATGSLELGIDMGAIDLVCQVGSVRSIATFMQRIGRANHHAGGTPKGRLFPLSRDELVECTALIQCLREGELDVLEIPAQPLDILAQQLVARCAAIPLMTTPAATLLAWARRAYPYRNLSQADFDAVLTMVTEGFNTRRGRRGTLLHHDPINGEVRARRGAQLTALTCGGAIPDTGDYKVLLMPQEVVVGTVTEDFAVDSHVGDVFVLGSMNWRIQGVSGGAVRVEEAGDQPPSVPSWLGESPSRSHELSAAVSRLRRQVAAQLATPKACVAALSADSALPAGAMAQLVAYLHATQHALGCMPHDGLIVAERFFDQAGGMQLVLHSPLGSRLNRAWGLALRKRFCKSFNFELQAAATEDAIVLSLGEVHAFPLADVFAFLNPKTAREVLVQALLDAPMFQTRWRWNAGRSLAVLRMWAGKRVAPQILRMQAEDLVAAVFPDQIACLENISGPRRVPDHPLVNQTIADCLHEAMDIDALEALLARILAGTQAIHAVDTPEPSPACHEILTARPYAFLDDGDAEERRTQAVFVRRTLRTADEPGAGGKISAEALALIDAQAWPTANNADEVHDALMTMVLGLAPDLAERSPGWAPHIARLVEAGRVLPVRSSTGMEGYICSQQHSLVRALYGATWIAPLLTCERLRGVLAAQQPVLPETAATAVVTGQLQVLGPVTAEALAGALCVPLVDVESALLALEAQGMALRGAYRTLALRDDIRPEWCDRRLLARLHRATLQGRRQRVQPVPIASFQRFLLHWHGIAGEGIREGTQGLRETLTQLAGLELPARAWEGDVLPARVRGLQKDWLDGLCNSGEMAWGRITRPALGTTRRRPLAASPMALMPRAWAWAWRRPDGEDCAMGEAKGSAAVLAQLQERGASFFAEIVQRTGLSETQVGVALAELAALGLVASDSFAGLRALLRQTQATPEKLRRFARSTNPIERAGRWSLSAATQGSDEIAPAVPAAKTVSEAALRLQVDTLLRRWGIVTYKLLAKENTLAPWSSMVRLLRRMEMREEVMGGHFIAGISGEQFGLPEAVRLLRRSHEAPASNALCVLSAADPLNLTGILGPGARVPRVRQHKIICADGVPVAWWGKKTLHRLGDSPLSDFDLLNALADSNTRKLARPVAAAQRHGYDAWPSPPAGR